METNRNILKSIEPIRFSITVVAIYLILSQGNLFMNSVLSPNGRFFNAFLYENLNYIQWLRNALINPSIWILNLFNYETLRSKHEILIIGGIKLNVNYSCLGLGTMSFIIAYVTALPKKFTKKVNIILMTSFIVYILNIMRITALGVVFSNNRSLKSSLTYHHEVFNVLIFIIILFILFRWFKWNLRRPNI